MNQDQRAIPSAALVPGRPTDAPPLGVGGPAYLYRPRYPSVGNAGGPFVKIADAAAMCSQTGCGDAEVHHPGKHRNAGTNFQERNL